MCLAWGGVSGGGVEWMRGLDLGLTNPVRTGGVLYVCVFWLRWCMYAPCATPTDTIHNISSTAPTYAPYCHPWICGHTPLAKWRDMLSGGPKAG